jgi:uncharacterized membrane protein
MHFASPLPWWLVALAASGIVGIAVWSYRRPLAPLSPARRVLLGVLRASALGSLVVLLARPMVALPPAAAGDVVVPVLIDASRSMRVGDAGGKPRLAAARDLVQGMILPTLEGQARVELFAVGDAATPATLDTLVADGRKSDLSGAIAAVRDRLRGSRIPGMLVLSDGGDTGRETGGPEGTARGDHVAPVFTIGIGSPEGLPDREVVGLSAGDPRLDQALVDLRVSISSRGFGPTPFDIRVLANGRLLTTDRVTPGADGSPIDLSVPVSPDPAIATTYTVEIPAAPDEVIVENNARSVLMSPAGRKRRVLVLAGAPGYDYSFFARALARDPNLEVDSVVRKGQNDSGADTFLVQATGGRGATLTSGFPSTREALFAYDALVVANLEGDYFTHAQLALAADFVGERGGGLLLVGGRSFEGRGLTGTPLGDVLPIELTDRRGTRPYGGGEDGPGLLNRMAPTTEGETHPIMRLGTREETRARWADMPPLAAVAAVGGPRPGATVLAVSAAPGGSATSVVAVQRYGRGRSMAFGGEASWRWRMLRPAADRSYEFFWRQALRWLAADAPDPVTLSLTADAQPGEAVAIEIGVRDRAFAPVSDATVEAVLTAPGSDPVRLPLRLDGTGRFTTRAEPRAAGPFRLQVEARRASALLGSADRWFLAGGIDRELVDPRLNEGVLQRLARESGGSYARASEAASVIARLRAAAPSGREPIYVDAWHTRWAFAFVVAVLSGEWLCRRRWGLR